MYKNVKLCELQKAISLYKMFYESKKIQFRLIAYMRTIVLFYKQFYTLVFYIAIAIWFLKNETSNETFC